MSSQPLFPGDDPMSDEEVRALGYEIRPDGSWRLVDPEARTQERAGLCRMCRKFDAQPGFDGWCAGCLWFGPGDPHGLRRESPEVAVVQPDLPPGAVEAQTLERIVRRAVGADG